MVVVEGEGKGIQGGALSYLPHVCESLLASSASVGKYSLALAVAAKVTILAPGYPVAVRKRKSCIRSSEDEVRSV